MAWRSLPLAPPVTPRRSRRSERYDGIGQSYLRARTVPADRYRASFEPLDKVMGGLLGRVAVAAQQADNRPVGLQRDGGFRPECPLDVVSHPSFEPFAGVLAHLQLVALEVDDVEHGDIA